MWRLFSKEFALLLFYFVKISQGFHETLDKPQNGFFFKKNPEGFFSYVQNKWMRKANSNIIIFM